MEWTPVKEGVLSALIDRASHYVLELILSQIGTDSSNDPVIIAQARDFFSKEQIGKASIKYLTSIVVDQARKLNKSWNDNEIIEFVHKELLTSAMSDVWNFAFDNIIAIGKQTVPALARLGMKDEARAFKKHVQEKSAEKSEFSMDDV